MEKRKVLMIFNSFFGYEKTLIEAIERRGMNVHFFSRAYRIKKGDIPTKWRIIRSLIFDCKIFFLKKLWQEKEKEIYLKYLEEIKNDYNYILEIGGASKKICIELIKERNLNAEYIMYLWDDLSHSEKNKRLFPYFNKIFSFNIKDAERFNLEHLPNFYDYKFKYNGEAKDIDIYYIGAYRGEKKRLEILNMLKSRYKKLNIQFNLKISDKEKTKLKIRGKLKFYEEFLISDFEKIENVAENYKKAKILLDITYKNQEGLGLRPIEAIASNSKLITTNKNIVNYDFYNESNIFVLEENFSNVEELDKFIEKEFIKYSENIIYKYSIDSFLDQMFTESK